MPKKEGDRSNFSFCFMGANDTGKSTLAKHIAKIWKRANPDKLIVAFDPQHNFRDIADYLINIEDKNWALRLCKLRNALIILDDYRLINESNVPVKGLKSLLFHRTDYNLDLIHIVHAPSEILNIFATYTSHYYIFYTESKEEDFKRKIPNYLLIKAISKRINNYVSLLGTGEYAKLYPNFPYMIIDCKTRKVNGINMINDFSKIPIKSLDRSTKIFLGKVERNSYSGKGNVSYKPTIVNKRNKNK